MSPNRSSAVMQKRVEPHDSLDDFPTPPWATRALTERLGGRAVLGSKTCREPAANRGFMVRPLREVFASVDAADIFDYGSGFGQKDYLFGPDPEPVDWTITNPPFRMAEQFIHRALRTSRLGCAVLVRLAFVEGVARWKGLFSVTPPSRLMVFVERAPMVKGRVDKNASTATAYAWLVWEHSNCTTQTAIEWIAPCRRRLERAEDYA